MARKRVTATSEFDSGRNQKFHYNYNGNSMTRAQFVQESCKAHEANSATDTARLMAQGVTVIYRAQLFDEVENISGYPHFLRRHKRGVKPAVGVCQ